MSLNVTTLVPPVIPGAQTEASEDPESPTTVGPGGPSDAFQAHWDETVAKIDMENTLNSVVTW